MKKITTLWLALSFATFSLFAQEERKNEINLGVGLFSTGEIINTFSELIINTPLIEGDIKNSVSSGTFHLNYERNLSRYFDLGLTFAFDHMKGDAVSSVSSDVKIADISSTYLTLALEGRIKYIDRNKIQIYSALGVAGTLLTQKYDYVALQDDEKADKMFFNFHVSPIGLRYGERFGLFAEVGVGYKGIVNAGLFARF